MFRQRTLLTKAQRSRLSVCALLVFGCLCGMVSAPAAEAPLTGARAFSKPFIEAARRTQPSVVSIKSRIKKSSSRYWLRGGGQDEMSQDEFFERFFGPSPFDHKPRQPKVEYSYGSGFIIAADGLILTNSHNIADSDLVTVQLPDGKEYPAKKIGSDDSTDIALLRIDAQNLPFVTLADSSTVEVGEWVLAIGNPFGLQASVTAGVISAKGRSDLDIARVEKFFQTDAAINMGNSGGPLVDLNGDVIGMNTAIATNTGGHMGIGFAIPSNLLKEVTNELVAHGHLTRGYLGVAVQKIDADIAKAVGLDKAQGALVSEVVPGGPAEQAGLRSGDVILALQGTPVETLGGFRNVISLMKPGEQLVMKVLREKTELELTATIARHPEENELHGSDLESTYGLVLEPVSPELAKRYSIDSKTGLLVVQINPESQAYQAGLRIGHVLLAVNGRPLTSVDDFVTAVQKAEKGGRILIQVKMGQSIRFVPLFIE